MKSIIKLFVLSIFILTLSVAILRPSSAHAADCTAKAPYGFYIAGPTVNATFTIPAGCPAQQISVAVYQAHKDFVPLSTQKLFSSNSANYGGGDYTIVTSMPPLDCFYQIDLFRGPAPEVLDDNVNNPNVIAFALGGNKDCLNPAPTPTPTPTPTPQPPVKPAAVTTPAQVGKTLPNTGPGTMIAAIAAGVSVAAGLGHYILNRRRS